MVRCSQSHQGLQCETEYNIRQVQYNCTAFYMVKCEFLVTILTWNEDLFLHAFSVRNFVGWGTFLRGYFIMVNLVTVTFLFICKIKFS